MVDISMTWADHCNAAMHFVGVNQKPRLVNIIVKMSLAIMLTDTPDAASNSKAVSMLSISCTRAYCISGP